MSEHCWCGDVIEHVYESWTCTRCRGACCPACAERAAEQATCVRCRGAEPATPAA